MSTPNGQGELFEAADLGVTLPPSVVCALGAPTAGDIAEVQRFGEFLSLAKQLGPIEAHQRVYGSPEPDRVQRILELPWTAVPLSMNDSGASRRAMFAKAAKIRKVRETIGALAEAAELPRGLRHVAVQLHYRPRDRTRRDTDNLVATLKPICDALAAGTRKHPGYGLVPDDTPEFMSKPEPRLHPAEKGKPGAMWLEISWIDHPADTASPAQEQ